MPAVDLNTVSVCEECMGITAIKIAESLSRKPETTFVVVVVVVFTAHLAHSLAPEKCVMLRPQ